MLFEEKERTRLGPMLQGELEYTYYDTSARLPFEIYRRLVNGWIARLPEAERSQAIARFRDGRNTSYQAALAELVIHEALLRQGYTPETQPLGAHPTHRLDFLIRGDENTVATYVEVTSINPTPEWVARNNREARIYNAIDTVNLPAGWRLGYCVEQHGRGNPNLNDLTNRIRMWAEEVVAAGSDALPQRVFDAADYRIELTLFGGFDPAADEARAIVTAAGGIRLLRPDQKIRQALQLKGSKYGVLNAPYLIVVADNKDELAGGNDNAIALLDAVFGSITTRFACQADGQMVANDVRENNGYWGLIGDPRHTNVSAVLLLPRPHLWNLRDERWQPLIVHNPWATHPLPAGLFPLPSFNITREGAIALSDGQQLADILGLPPQWPPEEC